MYAIINSGGKQYKITTNDKILVNKLNYSIGKTIQLNNIIMLFYKNKIIYHKKDLLKFKITAKILKHIKGKKIKILKFKRRKQYKTTQGYRSLYTYIKINLIKKI